MLEFDAALSTVVEIKEKSQRTVNSPAGAKPNGPLSAELLDKMHRYWWGIGARPPDRISSTCI